MSATMDSITSYLELKESLDKILDPMKTKSVCTPAILHMELNNVLEKVDKLLSNPECAWKTALETMKQTIAVMIYNIVKDTEKPPKIENSSKTELTPMNKYKCELLSNGFAEMVGMGKIVQDVRTAIIVRQKHPQLFASRSRCHTFLLYGPPGCGKTKLVHAIAAESNSELFCITGGNIMSSLVGAPERNILNVFTALHKKRSPSVLLIDEVDAFCRVRTEGEQDYSRRIKIEFMNQLTKQPINNQLIIIAATNVPWDIDSAVMRRFQKRIYVPLPNPEQRRELLQHFYEQFAFIPVIPNAQRLSVLVKATNGYSISDLGELMNAAADKSIEELQEVTWWLRSSDDRFRPVGNEQIFTEQLRLHSSSLYDLPANSPVKRSPNIEDVFAAMEQVRSTVPYADILKFRKYSKNH